MSGPPASGWRWAATRPTSQFRIQIVKESGEDKDLIVDIIKEMIEAGQIHAKYFESSEAVAFNYRANIDEIDSLMESFKDWERKGKSKKD